MTEAEWLAATDPRPMLQFLEAAGRLTGRKARLYGVACCRRVWDRLTHEGHRPAVEAAERFADGLAGEDELGAARREALRAPRVLSSAWFFGDDLVAAATAPPGDFSAAEVVGWVADVAGEEKPAQCSLLRDLFAYPKATPPPFDPSVGRAGGAVARLARALYDDRLLPSGQFDPVRPGVLADALEEADADAAILGHLRRPGPHVRGCWAVDLILGKS